jgi:hypothetical protein
LPFCFCRTPLHLALYILCWLGGLFQ